MHIVNDQDYLTLIRIQARVNEAYSKVVLFTDSEEGWEALFHFVFSDRISHKICEILPNFDWFDPDTTYQEDVCAFINAFDREMDELIVV